MKRIALALGLMSLLAGCRSEPQMTEARRAQHLASFDQVWTTVRDEHYDPKLGGVDWDAARAKVRPKIEQARTDQEARDVLNELLGELKLSHYVVHDDKPIEATPGGFAPDLVKDVPAKKVTFGNFPELPLRYHGEKLPGNVYYFYLSIFLDPQTVMPAFRQAVEEARDCDGFILDIRHNPGGIGGMAMGIGNAFVSEPNLKLGSMIQRNAKIDFVLNPQPEPYTKPLAILVDGRSASTSEILAGGLQDLGRARIFGTKTIGMALPSIWVKLPNGDVFQYAVANYISTGGKPLEGRGVTPDETIEYAAPYDAPDPVIASAVKWVKHENGLRR